MKELETNSRAVLVGIRNAFGLPALLLFSAMTGFGSFAQEQGLSLYMSMLSTILIWGLPGQVVHVELYGMGAPLIAVVLGVAGAAKDHYFLLFFGLFLSVVLIGAAASYFAKYIKEHQWVGYVGLVIILLVAVQLIIGGLIDMNILSINEAFKHFF